MDGPWRVFHWPAKTSNPIARDGARENPRSPVGDCPQTTRAEHAFRRLAFNRNPPCEPVHNCAKEWCAQFQYTSGKPHEVQSNAVKKRS
jgi:hypothetical protein